MCVGTVDHDEKVEVGASILPRAYELIRKFIRGKKAEEYLLELMVPEDLRQYFDTLDIFGAFGDHVSIEQGVHNALFLKYNQVVPEALAL